MVDLKANLETVRRLVDECLAALTTTNGTVVKAGQSLQPALDAGGDIVLEDGATFEGDFAVRKSDTRIFGPKAGLVGKGGPALDILPGVNDVQATIGSATTAWDQRVVRVGKEDLAHADLVPVNVKLTVTIPKHRGKTGFWLSGRNVHLASCVALDIYDPAGRDSQAVVVNNTPGGIVIDGDSHFQAGSEIFIIGGDTQRIGGDVTGVLIDGGPNSTVVMDRPDSWRTDGVHRKVKNILELKAGVNVTVRNVKMAGCWVDGQVGYAFVLTPRLGMRVGNVELENVTIDRVGGILRAIGYDDTDPGPQFTGLTLRKIAAASTWDNGFGTGRFIDWQGPIDNITIEGCDWEGPGVTVYFNSGNGWAPDGSRIDGLNVTKGVKITGNRLAHRQYGVMTNGYAWGRNWKTAFPDGDISGNTFVGNPTNGDGWSAPGNLPGNTWVDA